MFSLWLLFAVMMADVMGHGGDGAGDPPPPGGWAHGHAEDGNCYYKLFIQYFVSFLK